MSKLDGERDIIKLAAGLQVDWQQNAVQNIIALCHNKINGWLKSAPKVRSIKELETLVCEKVKLVFEEVWDDDQLNAVMRKYVLLGEGVFATLKHDLNEQTFATLLERRKVDGKSRDRYIAVIDCRGAKAGRRFFTRWHEIAHLLTIQGQLELPLHRSTTEKTPTERLMDVIAGEVGFFNPLFMPILLEEVKLDRGLKFETVERVRQRFCPEASYQSTLNACVSRMQTPAMLITVGLGLKKAEERQLQSSQVDMFPIAEPELKLRVRTMAQSPSAKGTTLRVHPNMQVPSSSILYRLFFDEGGTPTSELEAIENLSAWRSSSDGRSLAYREVIIRCRKVQNIVVALISPR